KELQDGLQRVHDGETITHAVNTSRVTRSTLKRHMNAQEGQETIKNKIRRPGPTPVRPAECENDIVTWVAAMQRSCVKFCCALLTRSSQRWMQLQLLVECIKRRSWKLRSSSVTALELVEFSPSHSRE
ncbi:hypothetical protein PHMEG_00033956, partial [Phytophthora megakarya]